MRRILIATEGSACSAEAIRRFVTLIGPGPLELSLLAVVRSASAHVAAALSPSHYHREAESCQDALDGALAELAQEGLRAEALVRVGDPATLIVEVAEQLAADAIVLGTHGRRGIERLLEGSVAETVLRQAPCGVFIFPFAAGEAAPGLAMLA